MQKTDKNAQLIKVAVMQPKLTQEGPAGVNFNHASLKYLLNKIKLSTLNNFSSEA